MWLAEFIGAWAVLLFGIFITAFSLQYEFYSEFGPGPGFLPLLLGIGILIGGVIEVVKVFRAKSKTKFGVFLTPRSKVGFQMLILIVVGFLLIPVLGISIALSLCTAAAMRIIGKHKLSTCALTAVGSAIGIFFIFGQWLEIPLPRGMIGF
ncbi:MAG: tripartite tricarboxylate transporter TctB family protein [Deltaproteobacteria bacterium]|nr:tripartite tricarboxylate transporter TctB family protein [Deltaproteobacteria bacterium]